MDGKKLTINRVAVALKRLALAVKDRTDMILPSELLDLSHDAARGDFGKCDLS